MLVDVDAAFDPQKEYYSVTWEYYRCCLLRTLCRYKGVPTARGRRGALPDLAARVARGLGGRPDLDVHDQAGDQLRPAVPGHEITADDFITALERDGRPEGTVGGYPFYYSVIEGFDDFADGKADTISGLDGGRRPHPGDHADRADGRPRYRFAMAASAPIPPLSDERSVRPRVTTKDYGRFLVSIRPVHVRGRRGPGLRRPRRRTRRRSPATSPAARSSLVRNPSWSADDGRAAPGLPRPDRGLDRRRQRRPVQQGRSRRARLRRRRRRAAGRSSAVPDRPGRSRTR